MDHQKIFTESQWKSISTNAEEQGHFIFGMPYGIAFCADKRMVEDIYCVKKEAECSECHKTVDAAYHLWKKDDWCCICPTCFGEK